MKYRDKHYFLYQTGSKSCTEAGSVCAGNWIAWTYLLSFLSTYSFPLWGLQLLWKNVDVGVGACCKCKPKLWSQMLSVRTKRRVNLNWLQLCWMRPETLRGPLCFSVKQPGCCFPVGSWPQTLGLPSCILTSSTWRSQSMVKTIHTSVRNGNSKLLRFIFTGIFLFLSNSSRISHGSFSNLHCTIFLAGKT